MLEIQPRYLTLSKLLDGRLFRIPDYQRAYSWTSRERQDLFEDIKRVHSKGEEAGHFMATVVCLRGETKLRLGTDEFDRLDVVDGQQRLTTLIILLNAIKLVLNPTKKTEAEKKLVRELEELLVKGEGEGLLLLQTNHDSSHHFSTLLREGTFAPSDTADTVADRELLKAIEECQKFVSNWTEDGKKLTTLAALLKNRLAFLFHEIADEKSVYTVFEVLNSRGIEVSWLDRLKSILMGTAFELENSGPGELINELHTTWRDIYKEIGLRQDLSMEVLRFAATLWANDVQSRPLGEKDSVEVFRKEAKNARQILAVAKWLLKVTKACGKVTSDQRLNSVTRISQARLLAVAIHLHEKLPAHERTDLLTRWEKVSFRIYGMLRNDARTRVGDYVRLAWSIVKKFPSSKQIATNIKKIGKIFPVDDAIDAMRMANWYEGQKSELLYLMFKYEEHLAKKQGLNFKNEQWERIWRASPAKSIEHIWAQSKAPEDVRHTLGNLILLPPNLNSTLSDKNPKDKVKAYCETGLLIAKEVVTMLETRRWSRKSIKDRETTLLDWAAVEWAD